ncbi:hypothetical protein FACS1894147_00810 [Spirochaetia bacterium]|nr:hypothetical protein FACS1894147_00810 [Spirochaetia bacterium]
MIYHYCSVENFYNIINSKEFWLFSAFDMNDKLETTWINLIIRDVLSKDKFRTIPKECLDFIGLAYDVNQFSPYFSCFSKDGDVLSQWRAYASDGTGVAIGIDEKELGVKYELPSHGANSTLPTGLCECIYDKQIQIKNIEELFSLDEINKLPAQNNFALQQIGLTLRQLSLVYKNPKFVEEQEVRLIHVPLIFTDGKNTKMILGNISPMCFKANHENILPYFKFNLKELFSSKLIPEIYFGPKCKLNDIVIRNFLDYNGLKETKIIVSEASYR